MEGSKEMGDWTQATEQTRRIKRATVQAWLAVCLFTSTPAASAAVSTWTGAGNASPAGVWNEGLNWSAGVPQVGSDLYFSSITGNSSTPTLTEESGVNSLSFGSEAAGFIISGSGSLSLSGTGATHAGIANYSNTTQRFTLNEIKVLKDQTWVAASAPVSLEGSSLRLQGQLGLSGTAPISIANQIQGEGAITVAGNVLLGQAGAANSFRGGVVLESGVLVVGSNTALGTGTLTLQGGSLAPISPSGTEGLNLSNPVVFGGDVSLGDPAQSLPLTFTGPASLGAGSRTLTIQSPVVVTGLSSGGLNKRGPGPLTLVNVAYTGTTKVMEGTLTMLHSFGLGTTQKGIQVSPGASLQLGDDILLKAQDLLVGGTGAPGSQGALVGMEGSNSFSANIKLTGPTLIAAESGTFTLNGTSFIASEGTGGSQPLSLGGNGTGILKVGIDNTIRSLTKEGSGTWNLYPLNTLSGPTTLQSGTLRLFAAEGLKYSTINLQGGVLAFGIAVNFNLGGLHGTQPLLLQAEGGNPNNFALYVGGNNENTHYEGKLSGNGDLYKTGTGTLVLSGTNTQGGLTVVSEGAIRLRNGSALGSSARETQINVGARLELEGGITVESERLKIIASKSLTGVLPAIVNISGTNSLGGPLQLEPTDGVYLFESQAGKLLFPATAQITGTNYSLVLAGAGDGEFNPAIATYNRPLIKRGSGTWVLGGASSYSGTAQINEGRLVVKGALSGNTTVAVAMGASLAVPGTICSSSTLNVAGQLQMSGSVGNVVALPGATIAIAEDPFTTGTGRARSLRLNPGSRLLWRVGNSTHYDQFAIDGGALSLEGALQAQFLEGFSTQGGATFTEGRMNLDGELYFLTIGAGVMSGRFANEDPPGGLAGNYSTITLGGCTFAISYKADAMRACFDAPLQLGTDGRDVCLMVIIPEPTIGWWLPPWAAILLALHCRKSRRG